MRLRKRQQFSQAQPQQEWGGSSGGGWTSRQGAIFKTTLLNCKSHSTQLTHLKSTKHWLLVCSELPAIFEAVGNNFLYILLKVAFLGLPEVSFGGCVGA